MELFERMKTLCALDGISGREQDVSAEILRQLEGVADEARRDSLGNVIAFKKGRKTPAHRLMLAAHMDEVGLIVTGITEDGFLRFATVGGLDMKVVLGRRVKVNGLTGVVATKALHRLTAEERKDIPAADKLCIDIGAKDREEAEQYVSLGDSVTLVGDWLDFGDGFSAAKALDDRAGCAMLLQMMEEGLEYDTWFAFTVQEEIGTRGAKTAAFGVEPDFAIVLETTASGDMAGVEGEKRVTLVGGGAVVSYMDHTAIYDRELYQLAFRVAKERGIPCQTKTAIAGGNDSGSIQTARGGCRVCAISAPCRYLHSPVDAAKRSDLQAVYDLARAMAEAIGAL